jgi:ferritin-like metal-binding protein YciE
MAEMGSIKDVLLEELRDIYSAEEQIIAALPRVAQAATTPVLRDALEQHLTETKVQLERLDRIGNELGTSLRGKTGKAMKGLGAEGEDLVKEHEQSPFLDALLIGACQRIEHYEIAAYGTARTLADQLEMERVSDLLQETLDEESATDEKLTEICEQEVLPECLEGSGDLPDAVNL